jgi:hypothetical protein
MSHTFCKQQKMHIIPSTCRFCTKSNLYKGWKIFSLKIEIVVRLNVDLYRVIRAAQREDSHQSNCNRLTSGANVVPKDLVGNHLFVFQVERQLQHQNTRIMVE